MVTTSHLPQTLETPGTSKPQIGEDGQTQTHKASSGYEQCREERIKENFERMKKLGLQSLSLQLKSVKPARKNNFSNRKPPVSTAPIPSPGPIRRSSRLQNVTPVTYAEEPPAKKGTTLEGKRDLIREGPRPEVYTEEHEKLLGSTEMSWTLFVDGYGKDGKRIYDSYSGKTCHQCRQKTMGHRTHCSQCGMVQGQFCGDCLYMRYGEHVLEANQNPDWVCPVCRGICNCSLCRQAKGWAPTGCMYKKISQLGYKSVAHYLIQTRRAQPQDDSEKSSDADVLVSAKKSLPFTDSATPEGNEDDNKRADEVKDVKQEQTHYSEPESKGDEGEEMINHKPSDDTDSSQKPTNEENKGDDGKYVQIIDRSAFCSPKPKRKPRPDTSEELVPTPNSIAGRLRQRRRTGNA